MGILKSYNESRLTETKFGPGGNPGSSLPIGIKSRIDDLTRMTKIIASGNGLKFISNNAKLNQINSDNKITSAVTTGKLFSRENLSALKDSIIDQAADTAKLIGSTLAQVPLNGTGTHLVHKFRTDTYTGVEGAPIVIVGGEVRSKKQSSFINENDTEPDRTYIGKPKIIRPVLPKRPGLSEGRDSVRERIHVKYLMGDPYKDSPLPSDFIGLSDVYTTSNSETEQANPYPDLAVLKFAIITPEKTSHIQFRAYITQFGDNFSGNWTGYQYLGRGENFYTYNGFDRSISLGFKIFAQSGPEMNPMYEKIQMLASSTAPTYNENGFMRGTLTRLTFGDYLNRVPGFIESVNYSITQDDQWDIGSDYTDKDSLPMSLDCTVNFKPVHTFIPQTGVNNKFIRKPDPKPILQKLEGTTAGIAQVGNTDLRSGNIQKLNPVVPSTSPLQSRNSGIKQLQTEQLDPLAVNSLQDIKIPRKFTPSVDIGMGDFGDFDTFGDESFLAEGL